MSDDLPKLNNFLPDYAVSTVSPEDERFGTRLLLFVEGLDDLLPNYLEQHTDEYSSLV